MKELIESDKSSKEIVQSLTEKEEFSTTVYASELGGAYGGNDTLQSWLQKIAVNDQRVAAIAADMAADIKGTLENGRKNEMSFGFEMDGEMWDAHVQRVEGAEPEYDITITQK